jgi:hypothetical protein
MGIRNQAEGNQVINGAYEKMRKGDFKFPGEDPALLALLQDIEAAERNLPQVKQLEGVLQTLRLSLQYPEQDTDVSTLQEREEELQSSLEQLQLGQSVRNLAYEVRDLLREAGKIE